MKPNAQNSFLLVRIAGSLCALPLSAVVETMRPRLIKPLADAPDFVPGVALIRGAVVPVIELPVVFGSRTAEPAARLVTLRIGSRCVALSVQSVVGIVHLDESNFAALPPLLQSARTEMIQAIGTLDAELLVVLQMARLAPESVWDAIQVRGAAAL